MHFCADEAYVIASSIPFIGYGIRWIKMKLTRKKVS